MASRAQRLPDNVDGDWFVDDSCIDCGACRWIAPGVFDQGKDASRVYRQPDAARLGSASRALQSCPTGSIGGPRHTRAPMPAPYTDDVLHLGFHSPDSYGATSWLLKRAQGNILVDSPRAAAPVVRGLERAGGYVTHFLSHRDDVADHEALYRHFRAPRVMHTDDLCDAIPAVEQPIEGTAPHALAEDLTVIPTPGHTRGSACLHWTGGVLFTGDTLAWRPKEARIVAFRRACWFDWDVLIESVATLREWDFEWLLPGHGAPVRLPPTQMRRELDRCVQWMRSVR